jgi:hypothetical protein
MSFYERKYSIPKGLLHAISLVETGTSYSGSKYRVPWPWTVNVDGAGRHFDTCQEARDHVKRAIRRGQRNIDVGCMQINLRAHPDAFSSIAKAFDPESNIHYGAQLLRKKYLQHGSWSKAVRCYHSSPHSLKSLRYHYNVENAKSEVSYGLALLSNSNNPMALAKSNMPSSTVNKSLISQVSFEKPQKKSPYKGQITFGRGKIRCSVFFSKLIDKFKAKKSKNGVVQRKRMVR